MGGLTRTLLLAAVSTGIIAGTTFAGTNDKKIAFSNNYAGNSWRQAMLKSYDIVTKKAVADGVVAAADVFTTADKEVPTQAAQIQNLILQGYDAIVINASSPDALNGAIKQACEAEASWSFLSTASSPSPAPGVSWSTSRTWAGRKSSRWQSSSPRAATCSRSAAWPARRSTKPSMPAFSKASRLIPSSRSSPR